LNGDSKARNLEVAGKGNVRARLNVFWNGANEMTKINALLITGGHPFERVPFFEMTRALPKINFVPVEQPGVDKYYAQEAAAAYDAFVCYDFGQAMTEKARADFVARLDEGKGVVFLHHAIYNHLDWPEFKDILGGLWINQPFTVENWPYGPSTYNLDQKVGVKIADKTHPITKGMSDFELAEETYGKFYVSHAVKPLLLTDHPTSDPIIGWTHTYRKARVVYLQPGHGPSTFGHFQFRQILERSICWVTGNLS